MIDLSLCYKATGQNMIGYSDTGWANDLDNHKGVDNVGLGWL